MTKSKVEYKYCNYCGKKNYKKNWKKPTTFGWGVGFHGYNVFGCVPLLSLWT